MNTKTTYLVLLLACVLAGYFIVFETDTFGLKSRSQRDLEKSGDIQPDAVGKPLAQFGSIKPESVQTIRITREGEKPVVIERTGDGEDPWRQIEPFAFGIQSWQMDDLLRNVTGLRYTNRLDPDELDPATAGLKPAQGTLVLEGKQKDKPFKYTLILGKTAEGGRAYVRLEDDEDIYVVADALCKQLIDKSLRELRSKSLTSIPTGKVQKLTLDRAGARVELVRRGAGWAITEPMVGRADKAAGDALVTAINFATIDKFVADEPESLTLFGLDEPSAVLVVQTSTPADTPDDKPKTQDYRLTIGRPADLAEQKYFAMWQDAPTVFTLSKSTVEKLQKQPLDLVSRKLTEAGAADLSEITIATASHKLHLQREKGAWAFGDPKPGFALDGEYAEKLVDALVKTETTEVAPADAAQIAAPDATITLAITGAAEQQVIQLAKADEGEYRVQTVGETVSGIVEAWKLEPVFADPLYYRDRTVLGLAANDLVGVKIVRTGKFAATYEITRPVTDGKPGAWITEGYDAGAFGKLLRQLVPLRAVAWIPEGHSGGDKDMITVSLTTADGQTHSLTVIPAAEYEAHLSGVATDFTIDKALGDSLMAELRTRTVLHLDKDKIASIVTRNMTVKRGADGRYSLEGGLAIDEAKAGALFDTVSGLRCEHWFDGPKPKGNPLAVVVNTTDERTMWLKLWKPADWDAGDAVGQLDDGSLFTLTREAYEKMTAKPIEEPSK